MRHFMVVAARALFALAQEGYQVVIATHSLFLLRETRAFLEGEAKKE